jgi:hypothetical protein
MVLLGTFNGSVAGVVADRRPPGTFPPPGSQNVPAQTLERVSVDFMACLKEHSRELVANRRLMD